MVSSRPRLLTYKSPLLIFSKVSLVSKKASEGGQLCVTAGRTTEGSETCGSEITHQQASPKGSNRSKEGSVRFLWGYIFFFLIKISVPKFGTYILNFRISVPCFGIYILKLRIEIYIRSVDLVLGAFVLFLLDAFTLLIYHNFIFIQFL